MHSSALSWFEAIGQMLDGLGMGMCLFDEQDCAQVWNDTFLRLFPEHEGHIHRGEPYRENLRRFYRGRVADDQIERYIEAGIARHQAQFHPFDFMHRGRRVTASSLPLPGLGRLRLWRREWAPVQDDGEDGQAQCGPMDPGYVLDRVPIGLTLSARDGTVVWANRTFAALYGLQDASAAQGRTLQQIVQDVWTRAGQGGSPQSEMLHEALRHVGAPFELALPGGRYCRVVERLGAASAGHLYAHLDITELVRQREHLAAAERAARVHAETALRESALLQAVLRGMEQGIALVNGEGRVEYHNQRLLQLLGLPAALLESHPLQENVVQGLRERGDLEALSPEALARLLPTAPQGPAPSLVLRQRSTSRVLEVGSVSVPGGGLLHTVSDVTERYTHQQRIEHLASHDALTGLLNRGRFLELLAAEVALAGRTQGRLAVLYLDLDGFKSVNDTHGHAEGDRVLLHVGHALAREVREGDFAARLGGDEFAVLQRGIASHEQADALAERLRRSIEAPGAGEDVPALRAGASVGVAVYPDDGADPEALMHAADRAMYQAKAASRTAAGGGADIPAAKR